MCAAAPRRAPAEGGPRQREWNKIWRELYNKNYFRALDYQAANFKQNDKKAIGIRCASPRLAEAAC
jgi:hypothetical protein